MKKRTKTARWDFEKATGHLQDRGFQFLPNGHWLMPLAIVADDQDQKAIKYLARTGYCREGLAYEFPPLCRRH